MHEKMKEMNMLSEKIANIKQTLISWLTSEVENGPKEFNVSAAGAVTDMIKDLAEAEEKCAKKCYYEMLCCEMMEEDYEDPSARSGYDNWRYSSGRYAPKGRGHRTGYTPYVHEPRLDMDGRGGYPKKDDMSYRSGYTNDGVMEERVMSTMDTMRDMWEDANPEVRKRMKSNLSKLMEEMSNS